jgi:hypothetical protein
MKIEVNDLTIAQGKTYQQVFHWEEKPIVRKPITGISFASGAPNIQVVGHGLVSGWGCAVKGVKGPTQLNAVNNPLRKTDYHEATVLDSDNIELNDVDPFDENGKIWPSWVSGGFLQYNTPVNLVGYTARMSLKDKVGGTELFRFDSVAGPTTGLITLDNVAKTITLSATDAQTAALVARRDVDDLEMVSALGKVTAISTGVVTVSTEVTTT